MEQTILEGVATLFTNSDDEKLELLGQFKKSPDGDELKSAEEIMPLILNAHKDYRKRVENGGYQKAERLVNKNWEKQFSTVDGFKSESQGVQLVGDYLNWVKENTKPEEKIVTKVKDLTLEDAMKNPIVQKLVSSKVEEATIKQTDVITSLQNQLETIESQRVDSILKNRIAAAAVKAKINLGEDEEMRNARLDMLFLRAKNLAPGGFSIDGESIVPLDGEKEAIKDDFFKALSFEEFITKKVNNSGKLFPVHTQDPTKGSPSPKSSNLKPTSTGTSSITSHADYLAKLRQPMTAEQRKKLSEDYKVFKESQPQG